MKKLLPILLALLGTAAGVGAGIFLAPAHEASSETAQNSAEEGEGSHAGKGDGTDHAAADENSEGDAGENQYVKLNNQFVVPVMAGDKVKSLVVLSLSLEVRLGGQEIVYSLEPKLRDVFLRTLFDHANIGGFEGNFTEIHRLDLLRRALYESARNVMGPTVVDVLITEIARQDQ